MKTQASFPERVEWPLPEVNNRLLIENLGDGTVIRAARNNLSERGRWSVVRHLTAEGFIPPECADAFADGTTPGPLLKWIIDDSWIRGRGKPAHRADSFVIRTLVYGALFWLVLLALLFHGFG